MPKLAFFIGKGGVGKTTVSSAFAVRAARARPHRRVLLISTDPAHSLADVLQTRLGDSPKRLRLQAGASLTVWETNSARLFRDFMKQNRRRVAELIERGSLLTREEASALLDLALPGMAEIAALLALEDVIATARYDTIVVDTAPFGHTLRLFELPGQFLRLMNFLELSADRDRILAERFSGRTSNQNIGFVQEWREKIERVQKAFREADLYLVTTPATFALNESVRSLRQLRSTDLAMPPKAVVLNRVRNRPGKCRKCRRLSRECERAKAFLRKEFRGSMVYSAEDPGAPIAGTDALGRFAEHVFGRKPLRISAGLPPRPTTEVPLTRAAWPGLGGALTFVLGKGGVGKTTISAALAYRARRHSDDAVQIFSVDPAPSLDDIFQVAVDDRPRTVLGDPKLTASELDAVALFRRWVEEIRSAVESATSAEYSGVHIDLSYERALFFELLEIVPPGLDEVLAVFQMMNLLRVPSQKAVVDMAPTGHALELLRTPKRILVWTRLLLKSLAAHRKLALAREAAVKIAELEVQARELSNAMKDPRRARIFAVMLPEPLPDRETERLVFELHSLGFSPEAIFVNRVLFSAVDSQCAWCRRAAEWQRQVLSNVKKRLGAKVIYLTRDFGREIVGREGLREFTSELWRLN